MTAIAVSGLTKRYGKVVGAAQIDLDVGDGTTTGLLGPNGAGKTTTLRCLVGLLTPTSGRVRVLGLDPIADQKRLLPRVGYLPGELRLYPELTGAQHLDLLAAIQGAPTPRRDELRERLALDPAALRRPTATYSRGMKQKLGLIQALAHDPDVVILDEPTEGLDPLVQEEFFALVEDLRDRGRTVLLSSHVLSEVQRTCERVLILRRGRVIADQSVDDLRQARARRVRLLFATLEDAQATAFDPAWSPAVSGRAVHLTVPAEHLVGAIRGLVALPLADLTVEEVDLDEAFLDFYRDDAPEETP